MTSAWLLNEVGLLATTVGALLIFMYLLSPPRFADGLQTSEAKRAYAKHQRLLTTSVGLLSLWLVMQDLAVIIL